MKPKRPQNQNQSPRDILQNFTGKDLRWNYMFVVKLQA